MKRTFKDYAIISLKGMAMGAADVVPGVSGGTIAFISGIYEELLTTISNINLSLLTVLKQDGIKAAWKKANANFILALLLGVAISVVSLAKGISLLLATKPILVWSFFFGLVVASVIYVGKQIDKWRVQEIIALVLAGALAYCITIAEPMVSDDASSLFLFLAGALAICAMILPGISGAFILVLLGAYEAILTAVHSRDIQIIAIVGLGAIVGLLSFSRVLKWMFVHYKNTTLAGLTGFILGSLNKIWPWKETITTRINSKGIEVPVLQNSILPVNYNGDAQLTIALLLALAGFALILGLEKLASYKS
ncbi:hypothetical protein AXE80_02045 [Wenyingzhuangia fucanilytica]|uniref:DUF368 domain-containing protein n=1 Tax=Wenyingzhuangia fucanilytica TaxID=1790137 RepID=A0A1B1Y307_9FLAO|nr:DUF368 domain-containing protein [Wenyingzhuangia fucanilytica]ANW95140.1 hypothetical protein AXE80_02045 [Wenyingzhuangia fucanilytica]